MMRYCASFTGKNYIKYVTTYPGNEVKLKSTTNEINETINACQLELEVISDSYHSY